MSLAVSGSIMQLTLPHRKGEPALSVYSPGCHPALWNPLKMTVASGAGGLVTSWVTILRTIWACRVSVLLSATFTVFSNPETPATQHTEQNTQTTTQREEPQCCPRKVYHPWHCPWRAAAAVDVSSVQQNGVCSLPNRFYFLFFFIPVL